MAKKLFFGQVFLTRFFLARSYSDRSSKYTKFDRA